LGYGLIDFKGSANAFHDSAPRSPRREKDAAVQNPDRPHVRATKT